MRLSINGVRIEISFYFVAVISLMLVISNNNTFCIFLFCILHELGHLSAMMIVNNKPSKIEFGYYGMKIVQRNSFMSKAKSFFVYISGPLVNIIIYFTLKFLRINELSIISLALGIFNILPIEMLDGGRIISLFLNYKSVKFISIVTNLIIITAGVIIAFYTRTNFSILVVGLYLLIGSKCTNNI